MDFLKRYQTIFIFVAIVAIAYGAYTYFFAPTTEAPLTVTQVSLASEPDQELIGLLLELKGIHLNETIFSDSIFASLIDFSKELVSEPIGRSNPFAPF